MPEPRPLIGPMPAFPTPWRVAERSGNNHVITCAEGHWCAEVPDRDLAELIVILVNNAAPEADPAVTVPDGRTEDDR